MQSPIQTHTHTQIYTLPEGPVKMVRLSGVPEPGPGHQALLSAARYVDGARVFIAGPGAALTAVWAMRTGSEVTVWTDDGAEAESLAATCRANDLEEPTILLADDFDDLPRAAFDQAMLHLPRGRDLQDEQLRLAAAVLKENGRFVFVGAKNEGVRSALQDARSLFGHAGIVTRKGGYHAGLARRPAGEFEIPTVAYESREIEVDGEPTVLVDAPGVFAPGRLDAGTENLIAAMEIAPGSGVLDIGCGTGLAGLTAARRGADVVMTDVSARAVESAGRTLQANGVTRAEARLCPGAFVVADRVIDTVIANPPFHRGHDVNYEVPQLFVAEAARVLKSRGDLFLVANNFLPYPKWIRAHFTAVRQVRDDGRFRVWHARGPRRP